jgi:hypothetical protein
MGHAHGGRGIIGGPGLWYARPHAIQGETL